MRAGGDIFWALFDEWNIWAAIVMVIVIIWQLHHSLKYRSPDGKSLAYDSDVFVPGVFPEENDIAWCPIDEMWKADPDAHEIGIVGNQWYWDFDCVADDNDDNTTFGKQTDAYDENVNLICHLKQLGMRLIEFLIFLSFQTETNSCFI